MDSNLLNDLFNIKESDIEKFDSCNAEDGNIIVHLRLKKKTDVLCPICNRKLSCNGFKIKPIKHKILSDRNMMVYYEARRLRCKTCNYTEFEKNPLSMSGFNCSIPVMNQVMIELHDYRLNYTMIAENNCLSYGEVINYFDSFVTIPKLSLPENLGIDEIHSDMAKRKDASYLATLTDNDEFKLLDILPSRSKYELSNYFQHFSLEERKKVKYVTIDMWEPYEEICKRWLPNCIVAVDPFHVIEHLTNDFTRIRVRIMNSCIYGSNSYYLLKKWHKLLETDKYNLEGEGKYNKTFRQILNYGDIKKMTLEISEELKTAYDLKESYRYFNKHSTYETAGEQLDDLIADFKNANIKEYEEFIGILVHFREEIINSFLHSDVTGDRLTNAKAEAMNEKIKTHIRISKGLSNFNRFRKRMLYCFNDKLFYALTSKLTSMKRNLKKGKIK